MQKRRFCYWSIIVIAFLTIGNSPTSAQDKVFKNSVSISYTTLRFLPYEQYIGAGVEYRFMPKPWIGVQAQIGKFPQRQALEDDSSGGPMVQEDASVLVGHRWGKVGIYAEGGGGVLRADIFEGISLQQGAPNYNVPTYDVRHYPDVIMGGLVDVSVGRRWSLTFNVRDNMTFLGQYTGISFYGPSHALVGTVNAPEGRAGVAFHF
jgi:hypothetical protein